MRVLVLLAVMFSVPPAFAVDLPGKSWLKLPTSHCELENEAGPEVEPQSPPLNVDDPDTPGCDTWEVNVIADGDLSNGEKDWELPLLDLNYGLGDNIELTYELPYSDHQSDEVTQSAVGESIAAVKYMFFESGEDKLQMALYPQLTFVDPASQAVKKGLATTGVIESLPFLIAKKVGETKWGDLNMTANFGYSHSTKIDQKDFLTAAIGLGAGMTSHMSVMGELSTDQALASFDGEARDQVIKMDLGFIEKVGRNFSILGSMGQSLYSSDLKEHTYFLVGMRMITSGLDR